MSLSPAALAAREAGARDAADEGYARQPQGDRPGGEEGRPLNAIALPPDWANYGEIISTFSKKYGIPITSDNPDGTSAQENQAIVSLKGDPRPRMSSTSTRRSRSPALSRGCTPSTTRGTTRRSRGRSRTPAACGWATTGARSRSDTTVPRQEPAEDVADLLKPEYKNQVALNGSPLSSGSAIAGVFAAAIRMAAARQRRAGSRLFAK